jgi:hypothetical protein
MLTLGWSFSFFLNEGSITLGLCTNHWWAAGFETWWVESDTYDFATITMVLSYLVI